MFTDEKANETWLTFEIIAFVDVLGMNPSSPNAQHSLAAVEIKAREWSNQAKRTLLFQNVQFAVCLNAFLITELKFLNTLSQHETYCPKCRTALKLKPLFSTLKTGLHVCIKLHSHWEAQAVALFIHCCSSSWIGTIICFRWLCCSWSSSIMQSNNAVDFAIFKVAFPQTLIKPCSLSRSKM